MGEGARRAGEGAVLMICVTHVRLLFVNVSFVGVETPTYINLTGTGIYYPLSLLERVRRGCPQGG